MGESLSVETRTSPFQLSTDTKFACYLLIESPKMLQLVELYQFIDVDEDNVFHIQGTDRSMIFAIIFNGNWFKYKLNLFSCPSTIVGSSRISIMITDYVLSILSEPSRFEAHAFWFLGGSFDLIFI